MAFHLKLCIFCGMSEKQNGGPTTTLFGSCHLTYQWKGIHSIMSWVMVLNKLELTKKPPIFKMATIFQDGGLLPKWLSYNQSAILGRCCGFFKWLWTSIREARPLVIFNILLPSLNFTCQIANKYAYYCDLWYRMLCWYFRHGVQRNHSCSG